MLLIFGLSLPNVQPIGFLLILSCQWTYWVSTYYREATDAEDRRVNPEAPWKDQEAGARQHFNCCRTFKIRKGRKKEKVMMQATRRCIVSQRLSWPVRVLRFHYIRTLLLSWQTNPSSSGFSTFLSCRTVTFILEYLASLFDNVQCHHFAAKSHWLCLKHGLVNWNFSPLHFFSCSWQLESTKIWLK